MLSITSQINSILDSIKNNTMPTIIINSEITPNLKKGIGDEVYYPYVEFVGDSILITSIDVVITNIFIDVINLSTNTVERLNYNEYKNIILIAHYFSDESIYYNYYSEIHNIIVEVFDSYLYNYYSSNPNYLYDNKNYCLNTTKSMLDQKFNIF